MTTLASTPRPLTPAARRRSWAEMPVRIWLVLAAMLGIVIVYFTTSQIIASSSEREMILNGIPVEGVVVQIDGRAAPEATFHRHEALAAKVRYTLPGEENARQVAGSLSVVNDPDAVIHPGDRIALRVDRSDPERWTDRTQPRSWVVELSVALVLLPLLAVLLVVAVLQRARILRIWQEGDAANGKVVDVRQTAIAPLSRMVRFTLSDGSNSRVCSVLVPTRAGVPARGEVISLVIPRGVPQRAVAAKLYI
jgi:hypothetical protein